MPPISAVIITRNEAVNIGRCLASLDGVVDEIIVLDGQSDDGTPQICREYGARVVDQEWLGFAATKNAGNAMARHDVILSIDADEVLSDDLRESIRSIDAGTVGACSFNRLTRYCGQWVRHSGWYPDVKIRLFDRRVARWEGDFVHETLRVDAGVPHIHLRGDLLHYSFDSISDHLRRLDRYSDLAAREMAGRGRRAGWSKLVLSPLWKILKVYLVKQGFRDGFAGLAIAVLSGVDVFVRYAKLYRLNRDSHNAS